MTRIDGSFSGNASAKISAKFRTSKLAWPVPSMFLGAVVGGYGPSVRASAARDNAASPVIHATRRGIPIGLEPTAARTTISRLKSHQGGDGSVVWRNGHI